ncbi:MAG: trehalose-phosphatase [Acidimicrobiales bacterium]
MSSALDDVVGALRKDPVRTAILLDFDGTLAPIVDDPAAARPLRGVAEVLTGLAEVYGTVAVISGRPVRHLQAHLGAGPVLIGLYGLERVRDGSVHEDPSVSRWRPVVDEAAAAAAVELPDGVLVEHKGLSLTLHVRTHPELAEEVGAWAAAASDRWGLRQRGARRSVELHPPVDVDKGTVVAGLLERCDTACFIGDDVGDLPAFVALDRFEADGHTAFRIVVTSTEVAPELVACADLTVRDPAAALALLRALLPTVGR